MLSANNDVDYDLSFHYLLFLFSSLKHMPCFPLSSLSFPSHTLPYTPVPATTPTHPSSLFHDDHSLLSINSCEWWQAPFSERNWLSKNSMLWALESVNFICDSNNKVWTCCEHIRSKQPFPSQHHLSFLLLWFQTPHILHGNSKKETRTTYPNRHIGDLNL